jgi:organizing structure protein 2
MASTAMATAASFYFLPKTTHNLGVQLDKLERKYPELGEAHASINKAVGDVRKEIDATLLSLRGQLDQGKDMVKQQVGQVDSFAATKMKVGSMYSTRSSVSRLRMDNDISYADPSPYYHIIYYSLLQKKL